MPQRLSRGRSAVGQVRRVGALGLRFLRDAHFRNVAVDLLQRTAREQAGAPRTGGDEAAPDAPWLAGKRLFLVGGCELSEIGLGLRSRGAEVFHTFDAGAATDPQVELARPDSAFWSFGADALVLSQASQTRNVIQRMQWRPFEVTRAGQEDDLALLADQLRQAVAAARTDFDGPIVLLSHPLAYRPALGIDELLSFADGWSLAEMLRLHVLQLYALAREFEHVLVLDLDLDAGTQRLAENYVAERADGFYEHFTEIGARRATDLLVRQLSALEAAAPRVKCVAVDLDDTMWTGVLREDGIDGVRPRWPFQSALRMLHARGILLAVVSKNDAEEEQHLAALLGTEVYESLVAVKLGWGPKSAALRDLASELNIGLDTIAFFDDNPRERAEVELNAPEVLVLADHEITASLARPEFQPLGAVTPDGARRAERYRTESARAAARADQPAVGAEEFLLRSGLRLTVRPPVPGELGRAAEMAARTNQLNATLARTDLPTLQRWAADGHVIRVAELEDRFGDYGLIGLAVGAPDGGDLRLDELAISCRAMGRSVEAALVASVAAAARSGGAARVVLPFTRSSRNAELERIVRSIGFEEVGVDGDLVHLALAADVEVGLPEWLEVRSS
jgi:FkbH-like protein